MPPKKAVVAKSAQNTTNNSKKGNVTVNAKDAKNIKNPVKDQSKTQSKTPAKTATKAKNQANAPTKDSAKKNRLADVTKGDYANKETALIGSSFNVNLAKKEMKRYINGTLGYELGTINAQYPYSAIAEVVALHVVRSSAKFNKKSAKQADLYNISLENLQRGIRDSAEYGSEIKSLVNAYNPVAMDYIKTFFDSEKALKTCLTSKAFNSTNFHIDSDALNFLCYVLSHTLCNVTRTACILSEYAGKKNIQIKNFKYACKIYFFGELGELISQRLSEIEGLFKSNKDDVSEESEVSTKGKKKTEQDDDEDDDEDDENDEEDEEEDEDAEVSDEEEDDDDE